MLALGTFIARFDLDMKIVDLNDKIEAQSFILANFEKSELNFRDIQDRLATVKKFDAVSATTTSLFTDITKLGQGKITFRNLTVETENIKIEAQAPSTTALTQFVDALKRHPAITGVIIDKVDNSTTSSKITVSITATLRQAGFERVEEDTKNPASSVKILEE